MVSMYEKTKPEQAASRPRAKSNAATPTRPGFSNLRPTTSDHIDTVVWDPHEHHHPFEDTEELPEEEDAEHAERQSDQTLHERDDRQEQGPGQEKQARNKNLSDAEKGAAPPSGLKNRGKSVTQSSRQWKDPETREWKDDIVTFDTSDDPANPKNWSFRRKTVVTMLFGMTTMCSTFASSVFSPALSYVAAEYGISSEVAVLGISLFVLGYVPGPIIFAPISELYGRKLSVMVPFFIFICFSAATATAANIQTIFITRFFAGVFASAPVSNVGGGLADMFDAKERATAVVFYSLAVVAGPTIGPIVGGAVSQSYIGWRWTEYLTVILASVVFILDIFLLPETFAPVLLTRKAQQLRWKTGRYSLHSRQEMQPISIKSFMTRNLILPIKMILVEPMVTCITLYNSFTYGILYMLFAAVPIVYEQERGYNTLVGSLPFLSVLIGCLVAAAINITFSQKVYARRLEENGSVEPELRLITMCMGSVCFPVGFFILGWTSNPSINWFPSVFGLGLIGVSFLLIFQSGINYLIDVYTKKSASAVAANTFLRSIFAAALPLVAQPMFHNLGVPWACTLLGCVATLLAAIPFLFLKFGKRLRARSTLAMD